MKRFIAMAAVVSFGLYTTPLTAQEHLVSPELLRGRLSEATEQRAEDLAALALTLSGSHVDVDVLAATLTDAELHDVAQRAARLQADPRAGTSGWIKWPLIVFAVVGVSCDTCID